MKTAQNLNEMPPTTVWLLMFALYDLIARAIGALTPSPPGAQHRRP